MLTFNIIKFRFVQVTFTNLMELQSGLVRIASYKQKLPRKAKNMYVKLDTFFKLKFFSVTSQPKCGWTCFAFRGLLGSKWPKLWTKSEIAGLVSSCSFTSTSGANTHCNLCTSNHRFYIHFNKI